MQNFMQVNKKEAIIEIYNRFFFVKPLLFKTGD